MDKKLRPIVRIVAADLEGNKPIGQSFLKIKGLGHSMVDSVCSVLNLSKDTKTGFLTDNDIKRIEETIKDPVKFNIPSWKLNRQKDHDTGEDKHLTSSDLKLRREFDIKRLMKMKSYKGMRHSIGLPVRGQKTKSNFRSKKKKGSLGVHRKKLGKKG